MLTRSYDSALSDGASKDISAQGSKAVAAGVTQLLKAVERETGQAHQLTALEMDARAKFCSLQWLSYRAPIVLGKLESLRA